MTVRAVKNQYQGINAHLHSRMQELGEWDAFYTTHIVDIMKSMNVFLRPLGYIADLGQSVQIRPAGDSIGLPKADIAIYDMQHRRAEEPGAGWGAAAPLLLKLPEALQQIEEIVRIYIDSSQLNVA